MPGEEKSITEIINENIEETQEENKEQKEEKTEEKKEEKSSDIDVEGYKGPDRRKVYVGEKRRASDKVDDDPEFEMPFELEPGKGKTKVKKSELIKDQEFLFNNANFLKGSFALRNQMEKNPSFKKVLETIIGKSFNDKNEFQKDYIDTVLSKLEAKEEKIEEKIEETSDNIKEMESLLEDFEEDSPQYKSIQSNIAFQKKMLSKLKESDSQIKTLSDKIGGIEKQNTDAKTEQEEKDREAEVARISGMFAKEFETLTSPDNKDGYKFINDDEKADFKEDVRRLIGKNAKKADSDEAFINLIKESAKQVFEKYKKRSESYVTEYIRKKTGDPSKKKEEEEKPKEEKEEEEDPLKGKSIGETLADAMLGGER